MTLKELKNLHGDLIGAEPSQSDIELAANGKALFYVSVRAGKSSKDRRQVLWAGPVLTVGLRGGPSGTYLYLLRLTTAGNARIDSVKLSDLAPEGNAALFYTKPYPANDPRNCEPWSHWAGN